MSTKSPKATEARQSWQEPTVKRVGTVADVLKSGGGKITVTTGDPGEPQKVGPTS
jgi:hypothetical protein